MLWSSGRLRRLVGAVAGVLLLAPAVAACGNGDRRYRIVYHRLPQAPVMNFVTAGLSDGVLRTALGDIPVRDDLRRAFEDASDRPDADGGVRYTGMVDVVEPVGSDVDTYLTLDGGRATAAELDELARDIGVDIDIETEIVARLDAGTRAREGERLTIRFDPAAMAVFDPRTGDTLYAGGPVPARS